MDTSDSQNNMNEDTRAADSNTADIVSAPVDVPQKSLTIKVKTLTGKEIELSIDSSNTVTQIKEAIESKEGIPPNQQRLIFSGRQMPDDKTAEELKLTGGAVLHLVLALRGGYMF